MTPQDLIDRVAELLHERPGELRDAGITNELNLQGWLGARNLRLVTADSRNPEISPGFWIAEHHDGRCVVMFDESPYAASAPVDVSPSELRRALVLVPLDPARPCGRLPQQPAGAGVVEALLTATHAEDAMQTQSGVELRAGRGIVGDRYFDGTGTFSASEKHGQQLTLIEAEVLDALRDDGLHLTPVDARRNIVTRGIDLNALVGQEFQIGTARCIGRRLCEPCSHLQRLTGAALLRAMVHRGGLRADILTSGVVHLGDAIDASGVELRAGRGIVGDRYFDGTGTFSASEKHGQQLTLIEAEVLDALREDGLHLTPADARRNVVTRGIDFNALVGHEFQIGTARCIGRRLCEPCSHLQRLTGTALLRALVHRGGLRADIITSGVVHVGDAIGA